MIVLIVSDSHGARYNVQDAIEQTVRKWGAVDEFIHCGDLCGDEEYISDYTHAPVHLVTGNCDGISRINSEELFVLEGKRVFLTHGDGYFVRMGHEAIISRAKQLSADIVLYGHTHVPVITEEDGITIVNPGSVSRPRQADHRASFVVLQIDDEKNFHFSIDYLE